MTATAPHRHGIVLFAHGSRDPLWHRPMQAVAERIASLEPQAQVVCAYLELSSPDLPSAVQALATSGVGAITICPMFLGMGKHAREDLPRLLDDLRAQYPALAFEVTASVGEDPRFIDLMAQIALQRK